MKYPFWEVSVDFKSLYFPCFRTGISFVNIFISLRNFNFTHHQWWITVVTFKNCFVEHLPLNISDSYFFQYHFCVPELDSINGQIPNKRSYKLIDYFVLHPAKRILNAKVIVSEESFIHNVWHMAKKYSIFLTAFQQICGSEVKRKLFVFSIEAFSAFIVFFYNCGPC